MEILEEATPFLNEEIAYEPNVRSAPNTTEHQSALEIEDAARTESGLNIKSRLYLSHSLSTLNSRVFEFGATLFLARIFPKTLLPLSVYALCRAASAICFAPIVGQCVDRGNRLRVVRLSIIGQRFAVLLSCLGFGLLATSSSTRLFLESLVLLALLFLACVEKLCSIMNLISVERDWVVLISENTQYRLEVLNSQMRRIDLTCKIAGPLAVALVDGYSARLAIGAVFGMNVISLPIEYFAIAGVYHRLSALRSRQRTATEPSSALTPSADVSAISWLIDWSRTQIRSVYTVLSLYIRHPAFLPSLSLSLLYLTVLSFSGQMVTYLLSVGLTSTQIGILRTLSTAVEVSATWLSPIVMNRIGPLRAGLWFVNWQLVCLVGVAGLFWAVSQPFLAAFVLAAGVILSRLGLWGFDLCVQIIVQEAVESDFRGSFSSLEASLQNFFELCSYAATIAFSRPDQFHYPASISAFAVLVAGALYAGFVRKHRGHLIHISKCINGKQSGRRGVRQHVSIARMQDRT